MSIFSQIFGRLTKSAANDEALEALRDDIAGAITAGHSEGVMEKADRDRLLGALDLSSRTVDGIMRHRALIEMIDADLEPGELVAKVLASSHTRLPVFRGDGENIIGILHAKDLFREADRLLRLDPVPEGGAYARLDVVKIAMKPYFIPDTTPLDEQMRAFLQRRTHFALVVDEYGALQGLITLEDILEEIVGEITDEFDVVHRDTRIVTEPDGAFQVPGQMTIRDLNREMDWSLPDDEANTIAGLVIHEAQMIPQEGQTFRFHGFRFEVMTRRDNRLTRLRLRADVPKVR
jgi:Mg2+/Co2+ transporter CorB